MLITDLADWKQVHEELISLAAKKAGLEHRELVLLLAAQRTLAWKRLGRGSMVEYAERVLGIDGHTLAERLRTAGKLEVLALTSNALREGRICYSAVRELTRVAVPETEAEWIAYASGKTVRQIEQRVSLSVEGDRPGDPDRPNLAMRSIHLKLDAETYAFFIEAVDRERHEIGPGTSQEQAIVSLIKRSRRPADEGVSTSQVAYTICESCSRTWVDTPRERVEVPAEAGERACCDANIIPSARYGEKRASQTVPPSVRRVAMQRARGHCEVPGCRLGHWKDLHHVKLRSEGGTHALENLVVTCGPHHAAIHDGLLTIVRQAAGGVIATHADGTVYGDAPRPAAIDVAADVFAALRKVGFTDTECRVALTDVRRTFGDLPEGAMLQQALKSLGRASKSYVLAPRPTPMVREAVAYYGRPTWDAGTWGMGTA